MAVAAATPVARLRLYALIAAFCSICYACLVAATYRLPYVTCWPFTRSDAMAAATTYFTQQGWISSEAELADRVRRGSMTSEAARREMDERGNGDRGVYGRWAVHEQFDWPLLQRVWMFHYSPSSESLPSIRITECGLITRDNSP